MQEIQNERLIFKTFCEGELSITLDRHLNDILEKLDAFTNLYYENESDSVNKFLHRVAEFQYLCNTIVTPEKKIKKSDNT